MNLANISVINTPIDIDESLIIRNQGRDLIIDAPIIVRGRSHQVNISVQNLYLTGRGSIICDGDVFIRTQQQLHNAGGRVDAAGDLSIESQSDITNIHNFKTLFLQELRQNHQGNRAADRQQDQQAPARPRPSCGQ